MATLKYIGVPPQWDSSATASQDLVDVSYINQMLSSNMSMQAATTQVNQQLAGFATQSWASGQMTNLATPAWAAAQVARYAQSSAVGQPSGPVPLQWATGQISPAQLASPSTQTFPSPFWSPANYLTGTTTVGVGDAPTLLFSCAVPAMTYSPYALACFGSIDTTTTTAIFTLNVSGTEGSFQLTYNGVSTAAIAYNATAAQIQSAIAAAALGFTVTVTGSASPFTITMIPPTGAPLLGALTVGTITPGLFGTSPAVTLAPTGQPVITVVASDTSQTIATGYGAPTTYSGPAPGSVSSQAFMSVTSAQATQNFTTLPGWTAYNAQGFTSTVAGNYLQVPRSGVATLKASVNFSGAALGAGGTSVYTRLQIIDSSGNVLAGQVNPVVAGTSGTVTASWTGTLVQGSLYTVQGVQYQVATGTYPIGSPGNPTGQSNNPFNSSVVVWLAGTFGTWTGGTLTLTPPSVTNTEEATIIPTSLAAQTHHTGALTLSVYLSTVGNLGGATATTLSPGLWVMPIPWS